MVQFKRHNKKSMILLLWLAARLGGGLAVILFLLSIISLSLYAGQHTIPRGVVLSQWDISGLTFGQFRQQLRQHIEALEQQQIELSETHTEVFTMLELGLKTNADEIIKRVDALGQGSTLQKLKKRWQMMNETMTLSMSIDRTILEPLIQHHWIDLQTTQLINARRVINADDRVEYIPEKNAYRIEMDQLHKDIIKLIAPLFRKAGNGRAEDGKAGNGKSGVGDSAKIYLDIPLRKLQPDITVKTLKQQGIERKITEFTTYYPTSGAGRIHNIQSTAKVLHDRIMRPGEVFDYSEIIRKTEADYGFKQAPVILNGNLVPGIGGGICQVSTTLYNAALRAGLTIVERQNHSLPIRYVPLGQDATFATDHINFKFRNSMNTYILIRVETTNRHISVKLFGSLPKNITYEIQSETVQTIAPPIKYIKNPKLPPGTQKLIQHGKLGYIVDTFRITKQGGAIVNKERVSRDHYKAKPSLIAANPNDIQQKNAESDQDDPSPSPSPSPSPDQTPLHPKKQIIEDGISSSLF